MAERLQPLLSNPALHSTANDLPHNKLNPLNSTNGLALMSAAPRVASVPAAQQRRFGRALIEPVQRALSACHRPDTD